MKHAALNPTLKRLLVGDLTVKRLMRSIILVALLVYAILFLYAWFFAEKLIFQPPPSSYRDTPDIIKLASGTDARISAIHMPNMAAHYTILYSHGNGEDIGQLRPLLEQIRDAGFSVLAYDYRGYGTSNGIASEESAYRDADAAYAYLVGHHGIPADRIIAFGRSLGGAVAVDLASRKKLAGLIVESSLVTAFRVMTRIPVLPFDQFNSLAKIAKIHCPVMVMHGTRDEVISFWHGEKLFAAANQPKLAYWLEGAGHNDFAEVAGSEYGRHLREFAALVASTGSK
ncbi:alpha/beta hydrolase [soil metagenome]